LDCAVSFGHQLVLQQPGACLQLLAVVVKREGLVRQPRRHVGERWRQVVMMRLVEMAKEIGQRGHLAISPCSPATWPERTAAPVVTTSFKTKVPRPSPSHSTVRDHRETSRRESMIKAGR
jgi:hypothetical protein